MRGRGKRASDAQILRVLAEGSDPVYSAKQVSERLPIEKDATDTRLRDFWERGLVDSKMVGAGRAWWITKEGRSYLEGEDAIELEDDNE